SHVHLREAADLRAAARVPQSEGGHAPRVPRRLPGPGRSADPSGPEAPLRAEVRHAGPDLRPVRALVAAGAAHRLRGDPLSPVGHRQGDRLPREPGLPDAALREQPPARRGDADAGDPDHHRGVGRGALRGGAGRAGGARRSADRLLGTDGGGGRLPGAVLRAAHREGLHRRGGDPGVLPGGADGPLHDRGLHADEAPLSSPVRLPRLALLPGRLTVARLPGTAPVPAWADGTGFVSITRRQGELSIVCADERVPAEVRAERGWRALEVEGPLHGLTGPLAQAGISVFAVATFDTDVLLVREEALPRAVEALRGAGVVVDGRRGA